MTRIAMKTNFLVSVLFHKYKFTNTYYYADNNSRPRLRQTSAEGSDYINASFIDVSVTEYILLLF